MERKLPIDQLRVGMFVIELDRPWLDTPFLLQGFLIEDEQTLAQLRSLCQYAVVDAARSTVPVALDHLSAPRVEPRRVVSPAIARLAGQRAEPARGQHARWLEQIMSAAGELDALPPPAAAVATPDRPESSAKPADGLFTWLRGWFGRADAKPDPDAAESEVDVMAVRPRSGASVPLQRELPHAHDGYERATEMLTGVIKEIRAGKGLELEAVEAVVEDLVESIIRNPEALQLVARLREPDEAAFGHALQVAVLMVSFGREIGFSREQLVQLGQIGLLLDIGKLHVRPTLLGKPGHLTPVEFEEVKRHVDLGLEMVNASAKAHRKVLEGIHQHHERLDGSGYPRGLKDKQIGTFGRMAGIVDCFSGMTSPRPYAAAMSPYEAMRQLQTWGERYFNAGLVQQFIQAIGIFPVGTLVELSTGESAVVIELHKAHRLKPKVLIVGDPEGRPLEIPVILDLLYNPAAENDSAPYIRRGLSADNGNIDSTEYYLARA